MYKVFVSSIRLFCSKPSSAAQLLEMKYLNVAEKNDAAKTIAGHLSQGSSLRREGLSVYNKIYEFEANVRGTNAKMVMTSVSGHLLNHAFGTMYKNWKNVNPLSLFEAPVTKICTDNESSVKIKKTLEREVRSCNGLIIWTDCDREGENIGFEIISVCRAIKPNLPVYRAIFSDITAATVKRALANLAEPDERKNNAVDVRAELDLRIGAAFTRFQTLRYQRIFPNQIENHLVSYGSCQIPTLGFVAERFKENENFIAQPFWKIKLEHTVDDLKVDFNWNRNRLFDKQCCEAFLILCQANPLATVTSITLKPKSKWRPLPMDTIELEKLGSRKLKLSAKETMTIAEKLYQKGFISYPRTETNTFSKDIDLRSLVEHHRSAQNWGSFASKVLDDWGGPNPRKGNKSDDAHPPIHPTKLTTNLSGDEARVYELIARHFLACVSKDATGSETIVHINVAGEDFSANGLIIHERNYLEVYIYDKWSSKEIHAYELGNTFEPTELSMREGTTTAPTMLTEAELIALMDKHGIGTDATHAEHINTIKEREYIGEIDQGYLVPGSLGMGLVEGYESINLPLAKPQLRAALEKDLKLICDGRRDPKVVLEEQIKIYKETFKVITERAQAMDASMANRLQATPMDVPEPTVGNNIVDSNIGKCPKCNFQHSLSLSSGTGDQASKILCNGYPECRNTMWLPNDIIRGVQITNDLCPRCGSKKIKFRIKNMHMMSLLNGGNSEGLDYVSCIICDSDLRELCCINEDCVRRPSATTTIPNNTRTTTNPRTTPATNNTSTRAPTNNSSYVNPNTRASWTSTTNRPNSTAPTNSRNNSTSNNGNQSGSSGGGGWNLDRTNNGGGSGATGSWAQPSDANDVTCSKCNKAARKLTVRKEGPNTGRQFYSCNPECNFFQWADDVTSTTSSTGSAPTWPQSSSRPEQRQTTRNTDNDGGTRSRRKCGICRQEGHTRLRCPQSAGQND